MAKVVKCDRCGKIYEPKYMNAFESLMYDLVQSLSNSLPARMADYLRTGFDLCPECHKSLYEWAKEGKGSNECSTQTDTEPKNT